MRKVIVLVEVFVLAASIVAVAAVNPADDADDS
jgi:hypothetical protein